MKNVFWIVLVTFICLGCTVRRNYSSFTNKYLVYSKTIKDSDPAFFAPYFIADLDDTIFEVKSPFGHRELRKDHEIGNGNRYWGPDMCDLPYIQIKKKDGIYRDYRDYGKDVEIKVYSFKKGDSIKYKYLEDKRSEIAQLVYSVYTGIDTLILVNGCKLKCREYIVRHSDEWGSRNYIYFIDKKTSLPIMFGSLRNVNETGQIEPRYILRFAIDKSEVQGREFTYPDSYYPLPEGNDIQPDLEYDTIKIGGTMIFRAREKK